MKKDKSLMLVDKCEEVARLLKYLSHPQKLILLCKIAEADRTVGELQVLCGISQSLTSQFLSKMKAEGLIDSVRDGKFVTYHIVDPRISRIISSLNGIF